VDIKLAFYPILRHNLISFSFDLLSMTDSTAEQDVTKKDSLQGVGIHLRLLVTTIPEKDAGDEQ
jgi:hypothetical protein